MVDEHGPKTARRLALARFAKWFAANYQSTRSSTGLRELFKYIANNADGNLRKSALELASLPTFSMPDKESGSKGLVSNAMEIVDKMPSVIRMFGASKKDDSFNDVASRIEKAWARFDSVSVDNKNPDDAFDPMDRENRELNKLRGVQNKGAEQLVMNTIDRIPDKRIKSVIRDEVMKSGNKLATLDKLLVQYGIKL